MKFILKLKLILIFFILISFKSLSAQQISDVSFELDGQNINIFYTLTPITSDNYEITTLLKRTSDPNFNYSPQNLSGDVGEGKHSGIRKKIIWKVSEIEMNMFDGDDFYFEVFANKIEESNGIPWYYYVGTAA
ncbi:MAG: hypothetical protein OQJ81_11965, partial [Melioribacteraceae bacterium]|nr:hypothetical protein [Melioribacteraceae bacterium]